METSEWRHGNGNMEMEIWEWKCGNGNIGMETWQWMKAAMSLTCAIVQQVAVGTTCEQDDLELSLKYLGEEQREVFG